MSELINQGNGEQSISKESNPLKLLPIDFDMKKTRSYLLHSPLFKFEQTFLSKLPHLESGLYYEVYRVNTRRLTLAELVRENFGLEDLAVRTVEGRIFISKEKIVICVKGNQEFPTTGHGLNESECQEHHIVPEFSFDQPDFEDLDLSTWLSFGKNNDALALLSFQIIQNGIGSFEKLNDYLDIGTNFDSNQLYSGMQALVAGDRIKVLQDLGLIDNTNKGELFSAVSKWLTEIALTQSFPPSSKVKYIYPYAIGLEPYDKEFPDREFLPFIMASFLEYLSALPEKIPDGKIFLWTSLRTTMAELGRFMQTALNHYQLDETQYITILLNAYADKLSDLLLIYQNHPGMLNKSLPDFPVGTIPDEIASLKEQGIKITKGLKIRTTTGAHFIE